MNCVCVIRLCVIVSNMFLAGSDQRRFSFLPEKRLVSTFPRYLITLLPPESPIPSAAYSLLMLVQPPSV